MERFLPRKISRVFLMLGNACNMNCAYCMQHPIVHEPLTADINPEIYDFLEEISDSFRITFYGGEPLLYFPAIKNIVETMQEREIPCKYSVITNGRAVTAEIVDFFNTHSVGVTVSWDGHQSIKTRGYDVFADREKAELLLRLNDLCLSGVISALAYPLEILEAFQEISERYFTVRGKPVGVSLDEIFDTGLYNRQLLNADYKRIQSEMQGMTRLYMESLKLEGCPEKASAKLAFIYGIIKRLDNFYAKGWQRYTSACGNGLTVLNMDLAGNLYPCHNSREVLGSIDTDFFDYLQRVLAGETFLLDRPACINCAAFPYCRGGCKLVKDKTDYCKIKQAVILPVLKVLSEYEGRV